MGSLLSPVIADFFMEVFEEVALNRAATFLFCYLDDTFMIWSHGPKELNNFFNCLNNIHPNI